MTLAGCVYEVLAYNRWGVSMGLISDADGFSLS